MDYTQGALDVPREALINALLARLGPPQPGAAGGVFAREHLYDLIGDRRYYVLTRSAAKAFVSTVVEATPWVADVCDCDSRTCLFGASIINAARRLGWKFGLAALGLNYCSKTLGLPHAKGDRMAGYHQTPLIFTRSEDGRDILAEVVQPPLLVDGGGIVPALWQTPAEEVRFWVCPGGIT